MVAVLTNFDFAKALALFSKYDLLLYWSRASEAGGPPVTEAYRQVIDHPADHARHLTWLIDLMDSLGHRTDVIHLLRSEVEYCRRSRDHARLQACLGRLATALYRTNPVELEESGLCDGKKSTFDRHEAMVLLRERESVCRGLQDQEALQHCLGDQALLYHLAGYFGEAQNLYKEQEKICRTLASTKGLKRCLGNKADLFVRFGEPQIALQCLKEQELLCRAHGDRTMLVVCLCNQASILFEEGNEFQALKIFREQHKVSKELGNKELQLTCVSHLAFVYHRIGAADAALNTLKEKESLCRDLHELRGVNDSIQAQTAIMSPFGEDRD